MAGVALMPAQPVTAEMVEAALNAAFRAVMPRIIAQKRGQE